MIIGLLLIPQRYEFSSKSQRARIAERAEQCCCWYHKGTNFQANHNPYKASSSSKLVVADTTKVRIFKQITTNQGNVFDDNVLLLIPQRYEFSSKSQQRQKWLAWCNVVADTTKVRIFKQITTALVSGQYVSTLLLIPQRYEFSSKSQPRHGEPYKYTVVADTTKVRIFKQITTRCTYLLRLLSLLLIPQRYEFSSKSQLD